MPLTFQPRKSRRILYVMASAASLCFVYALFFRFDMRAFTGFDLVYSSSGQQPRHMINYDFDNDPAFVESVHTSKVRRIFQSGAVQAETGPTIVKLSSGKLLFSNGVVFTEFDGEPVIIAQ